MADTNRLRGHVRRGAAALAALVAAFLHSTAPNSSFDSTLLAFGERRLAQDSAFGLAQDALARVDPLAQAPKTANYSIDVALDPASRTITGSEVITWRNPGGIPAYSIRMHLYWNAFRNTHSTWLRQRHLAGDDPFADADADAFGYSNVTKLLRLNDDGTETDLMKFDWRAISPDDQNADDRTLWAVSLKDAVEPGGTLRLRVEWTGKFPKNFDRTGQVGNYYFVSQWFPKLGVFQGGWDAHQFWANSEFFSDFGDYDVRMTVPQGWVLGATGVEQSRSDAGGRTTYRYTQNAVHDFAWTTSPDFIEHRQQFTLPGRPPVHLRLLIQPEHNYLAERHFAGAVAALKYYGEWYGAYPYPTLTIVDPPYGSESGGMEYPTIFTGGTRWLSPQYSNDPEYVVLHEAGHQFWYGMVANNEVQYAWLDEGINEYSDSHVQEVALQPNYLVQRFFGDFIPWQYRDIPLKRATDTNWMNTYRRNPDHDSLSTPTASLWPATNQNMSYHKAALMLHTLERMHSWEVMQRVMSLFFAQSKFRHPRPEEFFAILDKVTGEDHKWFIEQVYQSSNTFDYSVDRLTSEPIAFRGFTENTEGLRFQENTEKNVYRTTVVVRRLQAGEFPVDVLVTFSNGEQAREKWDGKGRWAVFTFERPVKAVSAQIDPERVLLLDTYYTNNSKTVAPATEAAATKWSLRWMIWLQDLFMTSSFLI